MSVSNYYPILEGTSYQGKLESVNEILDKCTVRVNFWGAREIITNQEGEFPIVSVSLDAIADKIIRTSNGSGETLSPNEVKIRQQIVKKIWDFYSISDVQVTDSRFITKIFNLIREQFNHLLSFGYSNRWKIENKM